MNQKTVLSLDIGSSRIKIVQGYRNKEELIIEKVGELSVPEYSIENEVITNPNVIADDIVNYLSNQEIKPKYVTIAINGVEAVVRDIDLPKATASELGGIIKNEMIHSYHASEDSIIQYKLIGTHEDDDGAEFSTYRVAAMNPEIVNGYLELIKTMKMSPQSMDINFNCVDKLLRLCKVVNDEKLADKAVMLIDFGADSTSVYIHENGEQKISRHFNIGSSEIEKILSEARLVSPLIVKKEKEEGANYFIDDEEDNDNFNTLKPYFYNLIEELRNFINFYMNRFEAESVSQIYIFGGGSNLNGLDKCLQVNLNIPTEKIQSLSNINVNAIEQPIHEYINAIGALIRY